MCLLPLASETARSPPTMGEYGVQLLRPAPDLCELDFAMPTPSHGHELYYRDRDMRRGITNLGNTCFVNAVVQVFLRIEPFARALKSHAEQAGQGHESRRCFLCGAHSTAQALRGVLGDASQVAMHAREGLYGDQFAAPLVRPVGGGPRQRNLLAAKQGDAFEFLRSFVDQAVEKEPRSAQRADPDFETQYGDRSAIRDGIFGILLRARKRCSGCTAVDDVLENRRWYVALDFPPQSGDGPHSTELRSLWELEFREKQPDGCKCPDESPTGCGQFAYTQSFMEREPPILVIVLNRGKARHITNSRGEVSEERTKIASAVSFPAELTFLRTGRYGFCGAILHHGPTPDSGHYTAICKVGDGIYGPFDDAKGCKSTTNWEDVASVRNQRDVYILVYARLELWDAGMPTGIERVPWARGQATFDLLGCHTPQR